MKIIYKEGNMFEGPEKFLLHGCNGQGVMNSGVAKELRQRYPVAFEVYRKQYEGCKDTWNGIPVGMYSFIEIDGIGIFNLVTQWNYGYTKEQVYVDYSGLRAGLRKIDLYFKSLQDYYHSTTMRSIAMPKIGAGLGGGNWDTISAIIEEECKHVQPVVYTL